MLFQPSKRKQAIIDSMKGTTSTTSSSTEPSGSEPFYKLRKSTDTSQDVKLKKKKKGMNFSNSYENNNNLLG